MTLRRLALTSLFATGLLTTPLAATDGTILINQAKALAGNVTPGDAAGFPVTITRPGSYRLSSNLTVPNADSDAIVLALDTFGANVTLDLNGFAILGPNFCGHDFVNNTLVCSANGLGTGIRADGFYNLVVMNGMIQGMGSYAIAIRTLGGSPCRIERLTIGSNGGGIDVDGCLIINNTVGRNQSNGIQLASGLVQGNVIRMNGGIGLRFFAAGYANNVISASSLQGASAVAGPGTSLGQNLLQRRSVLNR